MTDAGRGASSAGSELGDVIAAYLQALERGEAPSRDELLARHPLLSEELRSFLDDDARIRDLALHPTLPLTAPPVSGTRLRYVGDYELLSEIARGGMGVVYRAKQQSLQRTVALKMILAAELAGAEDVHRFRAEAEAAASLQHPGIVPIFEVGEHEGRHYYSMALVDGSDLGQLVKESPLDPRRAAALLAEVADAIQYAHERGIVHRDLKPSNVIVDAAGRAHVTDFGLAKRLHGASGVTATGQALGTPSYMPPEQAAGRRDVGPRSDVYSLGAVLYETLTGRAPYRADSPLETLRQVLDPSVEPVAPRRLNPAIPRDLETITLKCLEMEPERRYATAADVASDLRCFLAGEPVRARPVGAAGRALRYARRNRAVAALLLSVAVLLLVVAGTALAGYVGTVLALRREERARAEAVRQQDEAEAHASFARHALYDAHVHLARRAWEEGDLTRMYALLGRYVAPRGADLRGFEWRYLWRLGTAGHTVLVPQRVAMAVRSLHPTAAGELVVGRDDGASVWHLSSRTERLRLPHGALLLAMAVSPAGDLVATGEHTGAFTLRDVRTGAMRRALLPGDETAAPGVPPAPGRRRSVTAVAFSPDGKLVAASRSGPSSEARSPITVWDVASAQERLSLEELPYMAGDLSFSPDGRLVAAGDAITGGLYVWDALTGALLYEEPRLGDGGLQALAFSPDGRTLAVSGGSDRRPSGEIHLWAAASRRIDRTLVTGAARTHDLAWSPDGKLLGAATGSVASALLVLDVATGRPVGRLRGHVGAVTAVAFLSDGRIASGGQDGTVRLWAYDASQERDRLAPPPGPVMAAAVLPGGEVVLGVNDVTVGGGGVLVFSADGAVLARSHCDPDLFLTSVAVSGDGTTVALAGVAERRGMLRMLSAATADPVGSLAFPEQVDAVDFSPSGTRLAVLSGAKLMPDRAGTGAELHVVGVDGLQKDLSVPLADTRAGGGGLTFLTEAEVVLLAYREKDLVVGGRTGRRTAPILRSVGASDGKVRAEEPVDMPFAATMAPSPDRRAIAVGGSQVRIHDGTTLRELGRLDGSPEPVDVLLFTPSGDRLAAAGRDGAVRLWDLFTGEELLALPGPDEAISALAFTPDGTALLGASGIAGGARDAAAWWWRGIPPGEPLPPAGLQRFRGRGSP